MSYAELVLLAVQYVTSYSSYPMPRVPPIIRYVSREWIVEHTCMGSERCTATGDYLEGEGAIVVLEDAPLDEQQRRVVHEGIHHAQHEATGRGPLTCEENAAREGEAYRAEVLYTVQVQHLPWRRNGILAKGCLTDAPANAF